MRPCTLLEFSFSNIVAHAQGLGKEKPAPKRVKLEPSDPWVEVFRRSLRLQAQCPVPVDSLATSVLPFVDDHYEFRTSLAELKYTPQADIFAITGTHPKTNRRVPLLTFHIADNHTIKSEVLLVNGPKRFKPLMRPSSDTMALTVSLFPATDEVHIDIAYDLQMRDNVYNVFPSDVVNHLNVVLDIPPQVGATDAPFFYNTIANHTAAMEAADPFDIPELTTDLIKFQRKTVAWLLAKEGVRYDKHTGRTVPVPLVSTELSKRAIQNIASVASEVTQVLNRVCFGWQYIERGWFNTYTGCFCLREAIANYIASFSEVLPGRGLLAEEMGLGKTVEVTALMLLNPRPTHQVNQEISVELQAGGGLKTLVMAKTTLIVAPELILKQWYDELTQLAPSLHVTIYKGVSKYESFEGNARYVAQYLSRFDVVLATYATLSKELDYALYLSRHHATRQGKQRLTSIFAKAEPPAESEEPVGEVVDQAAMLDDYRAKFQLSLNKPEAESSPSKDFEKIAEQEIILALEHNKRQNVHHARGYELPLMLLQFWRVCLDEVQMVSSSVSRAFQSAELIPRFHAWGVLGTPIKRNFNDLHSVLKYARVAPFNYGNAKDAWERLKSHPSDFRQVWESLSLRHTKHMVRNDLELPPQTRTLITTPLTVVEQENYNQRLEECLSSICLDINGNPVTDDWYPSNFILQLMRTWLVKLRQVCGNPQIGNIFQGRYRHKSRSRTNVQTAPQLKTLEKVLDDMMHKAHEDINEGERRLVTHIVEIGQFNEFALLPDLAGQVLAIGARETEQIIRRLRKTHADNVRRFRLLSKEVDSEDEEFVSDTETNAESVDQELLAKYREEKNSTNVRLRLWYVTLHKLYFLLASSHFQRYDEEYQKKVVLNLVNRNVAEYHRVVERIEFELQHSLHQLDTGENKLPIFPHYKEKTLDVDVSENQRLESRYYDLAEECRRLILGLSFRAVEKSVRTRISLRPVFGKFVNDGQDLLPKTTRLVFSALPEISIADLNDLAGHIEIKTFLQRAQTLVSQLNGHALCVNEWAHDLLEILSKPLVAENKGPDGEEYEQSLHDQEKAAAYLQLLPKAIGDRLVATLGPEFSARVKQVRQNIDANVDNELVAALELQLRKNRIRAEYSLQDLVSEVKEIEAEIKGSPESLDALAEIGRVVQAIFENEKLAQVLFQKEVGTHFNAVFNARIEYFKQLQSISDSVKAKTFNFTLDELTPEAEQLRIIGSIRELEVASKKITRDLTKLRYLLTLTVLGTKEDDLFCIICRSAITVGSLTACGHKYCQGCLGEWLKRNPTCPTCKARCDSSTVYHFTHYKPNVSLSIEDAPRNDIKSLYSIYRPLESNISDEIKDITLKSSYGLKVDLIVKQVLNLKRQDPLVQIVVFSQWQDLLIILGTAFKANGISFVGSRGTISERPSSSDSISEFKDPTKGITCFLLNARAQASGLTLVNATHMFLCEPLVNTSLELQAISRIHRIGQKKKTTVWMFAIENSVEESIVLMSTKKRMRSVHKEALEEQDLNLAESMALMQSEGNASLVGKKHGDGEEVTNEDLWEAFFCARGRANPIVESFDQTKL